MFIVNITFSVEPDIEKSWLEYMQKQVIPQLRKLPYHSDLVFTRVLKDELHPQPDNSYPVQIHFTHASDVNKFQNEALREVIELMCKAFPSKVHFFKTVLKKI
ncbi:MAG: DUF4286 family protein [Prevotellaceae bacterium]|nr:DUF4286 family protein [Prevotellaceae bacterium]